jgi:Major Facilitator Superfamily
MSTSMSLLKQRRFLPLFVTQLLGAFNDNLFKNAMVLFVVYGVYNDEKAEALFSAVATAVFIIPFFLMSALAGQLADTRDKAQIIRIVKFCEILIMIVGGIGLVMAWFGFAVTLVAIPLMMLALFAMGVHSTFFGPIKYAILPQHLKEDEVLGGTGLVEAGTYIAILLGTILAGVIEVEWAALAVVITAIIGYFTGRQVPPAPPEHTETGIDWHILRSSINLVKSTLHIRKLYLAIASISFFWTIGAVLFIQFPPLAKNVLGADKEVASLFLAIFSIGIAIGSVAINRMLKGEVSARYAPACVIIMGLFVVAFYYVCRNWHVIGTGELYNITGFVAHPDAIPLLLSLLGISVSGGMFVVPLYAFLTTTVPKDQTARTVVNQLLLGAAMCLISAWLAQQLHRACD